jgi:hypothetical protein
MTAPPDEFREQLRAATLAAFGFDQPPSRRARWRQWLPASRRMRRRMLAMDRAQAAARVREAEFTAALPGRAAALAAELNESIAGVLPDGMRFEWTAGEP